MPDLTRSQFCELTRLSPDTVKSLSRREQLPFLIDQKASGRGYTFFEAFLTIVQQEFCDGHGINVTRASDIAGSIPEALAPRWAAVVATAYQLAEGVPEEIAEVMCGQCMTARMHETYAIAGTDFEIQQELTASGINLLRSVRSSASRCLAVLLRRSWRAKIEIPDDLADLPFAYRPKPNTLGRARRNMEMLLVEEAQDKSIND